MSTDYDPQKAHEYYIKHRKLKGRHSTKGFSDTQKAQFAYAKSQLQQQRRDRNATSTANINKKKNASVEQIEQAKQKQKEALSNAAKQRIEILRKRLSDMSPFARVYAKKQIQSAISSIKEQLKGKKAALQEDAKGKKAAIRADAKSKKADARAKSEEKYSSDLDAAYKKIKGS